MENFTYIQNAFQSPIGTNKTTSIAVKDPIKLKQFQSPIGTNKTIGSRKLAVEMLESFNPLQVQTKLTRGL